MEKNSIAEITENIFFYFRQGLLSKILNITNNGLRQFKTDLALNLFEAISLILMNRLEEAIHNLEQLLESGEKFAVIIALKITHKLIGTTNKELFMKFDTQMKECEDISGAYGYYCAAFVSWVFKKLDQALEYINKAVAKQSDSSEYYALKGWILLESVDEEFSNDIQAAYKKSLQLNPKNIMGLIGTSELYLKQRNFYESLNIINTAVVKYGQNDLILDQKLKIQFSMHNWDETIETINKIIHTDSRHMYARKLFIAVQLCHFAKYERALVEIQQFVKLLDMDESKNCLFVLESSKLFSKICNKNPSILEETIKMLENVLQQSYENVAILVEMGYQYLMRDQVRDALRFFKNALRIEESSFLAIYGLCLCEIKEKGITDQLHNQVSILMEMNNEENSIYLNFLLAKINKQSPKATEYLVNICEYKLKQLKKLYFSETFLVLLEPDFLLDVINEYITLVRFSTKFDTTSINEILKIIIESCPGLEEALIVQAKIQFLTGEINDALKTLEQLLDRTIYCASEVYLLLAAIQIQLGFYDKAAHNLEVCVSHNFKVRENPSYHYTLALIEKNSGNYSDAINFFSTALSLMEIKTNEIGIIEKSSIYIELIDTLNIVGQVDEASKILESATEELKGTPEEARILLLSAEHLLNRNNIQDAIDLLACVKPNHFCYKEAKVKRAEIFLKHRKDKYVYIECYKDFVQETPGVESYVMLGDAYMRILDPESALEFYEKAMQGPQKDLYLILKMGQALVDSHYFSRAVEYYINVISKFNDSQLKLKLAELYMNLNQFDKGELILLNELEEIRSEDLMSIRIKTEILVLLSKIQERSGNLSNALRSSKDAMENQNRVRNRVELDKVGSLKNETNILIDICLKVGEIATLLKNYEQAVNSYKEGLQISPNNVQILVALAKLYMLMNYLELCQQTCSTILRIDADNETAFLMMADIAFRKVDFNMALFHFEQIMVKQPTNWEALTRIIEILRRTGNITHCLDYLKEAEKHCHNLKKETKYAYCLGLYQWYSGNLNSALRNFNVARQDLLLGQKALYNMIEICLNPEDEMLIEQISEIDDIDYKDSRAMALKTAEKLIKELKKSEMDNEENLNYKLFYNFHLIATRDKSNVEFALENLISLASQAAYKDNLGIIYGIAMAHTLLKQGQRAKNQLKRVSKSTWTFEDSTYLERSWLLLVDYYIQSAKFDIASDLINKIIQYNKACVKAHEYLGFIAEKEQRYKEAANSYELAWKFGGKSNPTIGFKYSYCLLKCKKYPEAVGIAQDVLKICPDHPKIKKDILDKCMNNLRM